MPLISHHAALHLVHNKLQSYKNKSSLALQPDRVQQLLISFWMLKQSRAVSAKCRRQFEWV